MIKYNYCPGGSACSGGPDRPSVVQSYFGLNRGKLFSSETILFFLLSVVV